MTDYRCPSCRGGFPATAAIDDECPWCGEAMDGNGDSESVLSPPTQIPDSLTTRLRAGSFLAEIEKDEPTFSRKPSEISGFRSTQTLDGGNA